MTMQPNPARVIPDEERLGELALQYRGTKSDSERQRIAREYAETVERLIASDAWEEVPPPEDQLPDEAMPTRFWDYWTRKAATP
jgi:hypothetical protein